MADQHTWPLFDGGLVKWNMVFGQFLWLQLLRGVRWVADVPLLFWRSSETVCV